MVPGKRRLQEPVGDAGHRLGLAPLPFVVGQLALEDAAFGLLVGGHLERQPNRYGQAGKAIPIPLGPYTGPAEAGRGIPVTLEDADGKINLRREGAEPVDVRALISKLRETGQALEPVALETTQQLRTIATIATWWTLVIETLVAIQFLVPIGWKLGRYRDATLMIFAVTTYAVAPVMGFGWLLMTVGIAQTTRAQGSTRLMYLLTCFVIAAHKYVSWLDTLADAVA